MAILFLDEFDFFVHVASFDRYAGVGDVAWGGRESNREQWSRDPPVPGYSKNSEFE